MSKMADKIAKMKIKTQQDAEQVREALRHSHKKLMGTYIEEKDDTQWNLEWKLAREKGMVR
jgi:hypothetical protein